MPEGCVACLRADRGASGAGRAVGVVPVGRAGRTDPTAGWWSAPVRGPRGAGGDRVRRHLGLYLGPTAALLRAVRAHRAPAVRGVDQGPGLGKALSAGTGRARCEGRAGLVAVCSRLGEPEGPEKGDLT